jgi:hypothetical protein
MGDRPASHRDRPEPVEREVPLLLLLPSKE